MNKQFTGQKAQFLNYKEDGIKQRAGVMRNKKAYTRKQKHRNSEH